MRVITLGERIAKARKAAGLTQKSLALSISINKVTLSRYEKNHRIPEASLLVKIVTYTACDAGWLLTGLEHNKAARREFYTPKELEYIDKLEKIFRTKKDDIINAVTHNIDACLQTQDDQEKIKDEEDLIK